MARSCNRHESGPGRPIPFPVIRRYEKDVDGQSDDEGTGTARVVAAVSRNLGVRLSDLKTRRYENAESRRKEERRQKQEESIGEARMSSELETGIDGIVASHSETL